MLYTVVLIAIHMKATELYFPVVLFTMQYKVVFIANQMRATEQYFPVVLFITL